MGVQSVAGKSVTGSGAVSDGAGTRPLASALVDVTRRWADAQFRLVTLAAEFADSAEWVLESPTAAHWLAATADVETCTAREWIRIGHKLRDLPAIAGAFEGGVVSYSKVRTLTRFATVENEADLLAIAVDVPASELGRALAVWFTGQADPGDLEAHQHALRSVKWRTEADGMVVFTLRLPPLLAGILIATLTRLVMRSAARREPDGTWPTTNQQYADAIEEVLAHGTGEVATEVVLHVRGDGATLDDGSPITDSVVERIAPTAFLRAMIHDAEANPVDVSNRRRHPSIRQKRFVKERDRACRDCGSHELLEYDHNPAHEQTGHTLTSELELRCASCHHRRHRG
jgi:hypothetical protein